MKTYEISKILGRELMSRLLVGDLYTIIQNSYSGEDVVIDFSNVYFVTRSFADEFFNVFLKNNSFPLTLANVSEDIEIMLMKVRETQNVKKTIAADKGRKVKSFKEFENVLMSIGL